MSDIKRKVGTFTDEELKTLERVYIEDGTGKKTVAGLGSGIVCIVGEFLKGTPNVPVLCTTEDDINNNFGGWSPYSNPGFDNDFVTTGSIDPSLTLATSTEGIGYFRVQNPKYAQLYLMNVDQAVATCTLTLSGSGALTIPAGVCVADADDSDIFALCDDLVVASADYLSGSAVFEDVRLRRVKGTDLAPTLTKCVDTLDLLSALRLPTNQLTITPSALSTVTALTQSFIESSYSDAIDELSTEDENLKEISITVACRHSVTIANLLKADAVSAQANNAIGRIAVISPIVGTLKAAAWDDEDDTVCVGNSTISRSDAVVFAWPGHKEYFADLGGDLEVTSDFAIASEISQTEPEASIGRKTVRLNYVKGIETANRALKTPDYEYMKSQGICGIRMNKSKGPQIQSACTSVDPLLDSTLVNIARRRMSTFISGSLANFADNFKSEKYNETNYSNLCTGVSTFLQNLLDGERIAGYATDYSTGNTFARTSQGIVTLIVEVQTLAPMDYIVFKTSIGETVEITVS
jgi:hypothetical protein